MSATLNAECFTAVTLLPSTDPQYVTVETLFKSTWQAAIVQDPAKAPVGNIKFIFALNVPAVLASYNAYKAALPAGVPANEADVFHGTGIECDIATTQVLCSSATCSLCQIAQNGFDVGRCGSNIKFKRFGNGTYFAPHSSKWYAWCWTVSDCCYLTA